MKKRVKIVNNKNKEKLLYEEKEKWKFRGASKHGKEEDI